MKKLVAVTMLFALSLLTGAGLSVFLVEDVQACICVGPWDVVMTCDTGPKCSGGTPYYEIKWGLCDGNPCWLFSGCHDGVHAGC